MVAMIHRRDWCDFFTGKDPGGLSRRICWRIHMKLCKKSQGRNENVKHCEPTAFFSKWGSDYKDACLAKDSQVGRVPASPVYYHLNMMIQHTPRRQRRQQPLWPPAKQRPGWMVNVSYAGSGQQNSIKMEVVNGCHQSLPNPDEKR